MRNILVLTLCLISFSAFADSKSDSMLKVMNDAGVSSIGRKLWQQASLNCRIPHFGKDKSLKCILRANTLDFDSDLYVEYTGVDAEYISSLLEEFEVLPQGKYLKQAANVECRLMSPKTSDKKVCDIVSSDMSSFH